MTKSIKIQVTEDGQKYFIVYEVRVKKHDGEVCTYDRFLKKVDAEDAQETVYRFHQKLYKTAWIREQIVWC